MTRAALQFSSVSERFIQEYTKPWDECIDRPECSLLRLSIMRELYRYLHAERSKILVEGAKKSVEDLRSLQLDLEAFRTQDLNKITLRELFSKPKRGTVIARTPPTQVYSIIEKEKLDRYDRKWESAIAAEAYKIGWKFWTMDAWVKISTAESFHGHLNRNLWPTGVVLYVEASPGSPVGNADEPIWKGRWICVIAPQIDPKALPLASIPGISNQPESPAWK